MHLSALTIYPVKSLRGCEVAQGVVDPLGLVGDRRFMLIDENGRFLSQRTLPRMALITTTLTDASLTLAADAQGEFSVSRAPDSAAPLRNVSIWKSDGLLAEDCGEGVAGWLSNALQAKCRLVRIGEKFMRPVLKPDVAGPGDLVSCADAFPFLVISEASLADLNRRLVADGGEALPMNRFRPNLVVAGAEPFAEDTWTRFRIGMIKFHAGGPCIRCPVTTTDQATAARGKEPLRTLATYRRSANDPTDVKFGQNLIHETKAGRLLVGDAVEIL